MNWTVFVSLIDIVHLIQFDSVLFGHQGEFQIDLGDFSDWFLCF